MSHMKASLSQTQLNSFIIFRLHNCQLTLSLQSMYRQHIKLPQSIQSAQSVHISVMPYLWTIIVDLAVILAKYKYTKYAIILHAIICTFISIATLATALPILFEEGIYAKQTERYDKRHYIIGVFLMFLILGQIVIGFLSKILQVASWKNSYAIFLFNTVHKYMGYTLVIFGKIQVFLTLGFDLDNVPLFWGLIASQIVMILIWLPRTLLFPKLQEKILPDCSDLKVQIKKIRHLGQIQEKRTRNLGVFANYVYDLSVLKNFHPAGSQLIKSVAKRGLDRYLYGMQISESQPKIPTNSHSYKALKLLGNPLAKIQILSPYSGFESDIIDVYLSKIITVSQKGGIYQVYLRADNQTDFSYKGYTYLEQLGRFYSLTINEKITRLYTCIGSLAESNINFLEKNVFAHKEISIRSLQLKTHYTDLQSTQQKGLQTSDQICLLVKRYQSGKLTSQLFDKIPRNLKLSCLRGEGLKMLSVQPGHIIIVAGGTGIYPFCDLIDLLFKNYLLHTYPHLIKQILTADPILVSNPFNLFRFTLYLSVNYVEDLHPLTFAELNELSKHSQKIFKMYFRVSKASNQKRMNEKVEFVSDQFYEAFQKEVIKLKFEKIWICGPPRMNREVVENLSKMGIDKEKFLII